jgi:hypothetical protein
MRSPTHLTGSALDMLTRLHGILTTLRPATADKAG